MVENNVPVDSLEGISFLIRWARAGGWVLNATHKRLADKYGVDTEGVIFACPIPVHTSKSVYRRTT